MRAEKVQNALDPSEERFRLLVDSVSDYAIFILDPTGKIVSWNPGAQRLKGYEPDEILGRHFSIFYPEDDKATPAWELKEATEKGRVAVEGWRLRKDGTRFWAGVVITAMREPSGELIGFAKVTRDLSERKEAEERLRASEEQFRRLVETIEEYAIYMVDPNGTIETWNAGAEKIKLYKAADIIGKNFACFYTAEDVAAGIPERNLKEAARLGHVRDQGVRVRKDGTTFYADVVLSALRDDNGNLRGFSKVTRDMTEQVRNRETEAAKIAAEKANQAKDNFLAALSHELRTPLTPALAAASFLAYNSERLPADLLEEVDTIRRNVQLEARLIDDLLDLTRITRGKIELRFEGVDAHAAIQEALAIARPDSETKNLRISLLLKAQKHHIWADPIRIRQVFWNLINNAVKFTPAKGKIEIATANDGNELVLEVRDNGIGIDSKQQQSLFKPFEQGHSSVTRQFGGLGLGLAISKLLMDLHEGRIEVESAGRSHGATFRVTMALARAELGAKEAKARVEPKSTKSLRILLVEDHGDTRQTLSRLLRHFGHQISVADSTQAALEFVDLHEFDVVLSDIGLPDGTGYEVISQAKKKHRVTGVALTGFGSDEDIRRGKEAGFDYHLTKPIDFHELRTVLDQV